MLKGIVRQRLGGSKSASSVKNAPLGSAEVSGNYRIVCCRRNNQSNLRDIFLLP